MLTQAIDRNAPAVLALPSAGMVRYYKSRFLRAVDHRVWLEGIPEERPLIETLIQDARSGTGFFQGGSSPVEFYLADYWYPDYKYRFFLRPRPSCPRC